MKRAFKIIVKWILRIVLGLAALLVLVVMLFYLFRGKIVDRAVDYVNELQPGEVSLGKLNINPFVHFPDVALQLKELQYLSVFDDTLSSDNHPVFNLEEIYVSLDVFQLIRGNYEVSNISFGDGEINYSVGEDSISNLEKALGIRFGEAPEKEENDSDSSILSFDIENIQIRNLIVNYTDIPGSTRVSLKINGLRSGISYYPDLISANIMTHMDLNTAKINEIVLDKSRSVSLNASMIFNQITEEVDITQTALAVNEAVFEVDGNINLAQENLHLNFSAQNKGIELLNFLLSGILDIDAIEQIGEGKMKFDGEVAGSYHNAMPEISLNFMAEDMAFNVKAINQKVTNIGFEGFARNGTKKDLSEAEFRLDTLHMDFEDGAIDARLGLANLIEPRVSMDINARTDLSVLNEILDTESLQNMKGNLRINGDLRGQINKETGDFLEDGGRLELELQEVQFSLPDNEIEGINGSILIDEQAVSFRDMQVRIDSNEINLDGSIDNLLPYLFDFSVDPKLSFRISSNELFYYKFLGDSIFKNPLRDLSFTLDLGIQGEQLTKAIDEKAIPKLVMSLSNFEVKVPGYAEISNLDLSVEVDENDIYLEGLTANIGDSHFEFLAEVNNYGAYLDKDSSENISFGFSLSSNMLKASDLLTIGDEFKVLPLGFSDEQIESLYFKGKLEAGIHELLTDSILPDFKFFAEEFAIDLKYYPHSIHDFSFDISYMDTLLSVNNFEGSIGSNNIGIVASISNLLDSTKVLSGFVDLHSDYLNVNELLDYPLLENSDSSADSVLKDSIVKNPVRLDLIDLPDIELNLDLAELHFEGNILRHIGGAIILKPYHILYLDQFRVQSEQGGSLMVDGQFNVADPSVYTLSARLEIDTLDVNDFDVQLTMGDTLYSLSDNFSGVVSGDGIAELFINQDFSINLDTSTAMFNILLVDGRIRNFTPLQALGKFTGNKDLDDVQFGELRNSFTLSDGAIQIPLMAISSTLGLILIEGEQGLEGEFLYLVRVPTKLLRGTAWNVVSNQQRKDTEEDAEVESLESQKVARLTIYGKGEEFEVKLGDKRDKYLQTESQ